MRALIVGDAAAAEDAYAAFARWGERGYLYGAQVAEMQAVIWHNAVFDDIAITSGVLLPGLRAIVDETVPEPMRTRTWAAYGPVLARMSNGSTDPRPGATGDAAADLLMGAVYAAWFARQPVSDPDRAEAELGELIGYLDDSGRTFTSTTLSNRVLAQARRALVDITGGAMPLRALERRGRVDPVLAATILDQQLAAAADVATNPAARLQVRRLQQFQQALSAAWEG